jgi:aryl sulfotransferase
MLGVATPARWTLEKLGYLERVLGSAGARRERNLVRTNPFRGYTPGAQDVFVMTYAKSGTNWAMQIAHQLIYHGRGEFDHLHDIVPWPDTAAMGGFLKRYAIPLDQASHWQASPERKRVIKTHFNWELLPYSEHAHYIAVIRDPKDVLVSNYLFVRDSLYGAAMPSIDTWFKLFLTPDFVLGGSWAVNAAGYWAQRRRPNVLILSFKALKRDLKAAVVTVADFLSIRVSDDVIAEVCRKSTFEYMKQIDHKFRIGKMTPWLPEGAMIRRGMQGGSSELLSPECQRQLDAHFMAELKRLGSDLPYEEFCDIAP